MSPRFFTSEWQAVSFVKVVLLAVMVVCLFVAPLLALLSWVVWQSKVDAAIAVSCFGAAAVCAALFRFLYRWSYDMKEEPVEERTVRDDIVPDGFSEWRAGSLEDRAGLCEREFFLNALVNPRSVFSRINEYITPGRRMLDCDVHFEVEPHGEHHGIAIRGFDDLDVKRAGAKGAVSCALLVPVAFQERGGLTISQRVYGSSGVNLPLVKQSYITQAFLGMIDGYMALRRSALSESLRAKLAAYLDRTERNESVMVPEAVCSAMLSAGDPDRAFCRDLLLALVGLRDVIPICVSLHAAAVDMGVGDKDAGRGRRRVEGCDLDGLPPGVPRVFKLRLEEKREMVEKPASFIPNRRGSRLVGALNRLFGLCAGYSDTVYYNLANASRSTSYHLRVMGPESTYYARGSLLRQNPLDQRPIYAEQVAMQRRGGQRNAHLYIRSGHRMVNTAFMFRFRKAPLDSYHIMFVAALLCVSVLAVCFMGSFSTLKPNFVKQACEELNPARSVGFSAVSMLLAVVSAAGSWIYSRAWDGREDGFGILASVAATVCCSVSGMLLSGAAFAGVVPDGAEGVVLVVWCVLVSVMSCATLMLGYAAVLHGSIYRYLLAKKATSGHRDVGGRVGSRGHLRPGGGDWIVDDRSVGHEVVDGQRGDTPPGRYVTNDYRLWIKTIREYEKSYGVRQER